MTAESTEALARGLKAAGDPTRLRILAALTGGTRCVCEIQELVGAPANLLSHHLRVLREAGLIRGDRRGRWIDYTLEDAPLERLRAALPPRAADVGLDLSRAAGCAPEAEAP